MPTIKGRPPDDDPHSRRTPADTHADPKGSRDSAKMTPAGKLPFIVFSNMTGMFDVTCTNCCPIQQSPGMWHCFPEDDNRKWMARYHALTQRVNAVEIGNALVPFRIWLEPNQEVSVATSDPLDDTNPRMITAKDAFGAAEWSNNMHIRWFFIVPRGLSIVATPLP